EEKIELRVAAADGIRLVSEISGNGPGHQMQCAAGDAEPASRVDPGAAGGLIAKGGMERLDDLRYGDELLDIVLAKVEWLHFVFMTKTPLQSSGGGDFFNCSQRSIYIWETTSAGFIARASRKAPVASSHRRSR